MSGEPRGGHKDGGRVLGDRAPHPCGPPVTPPTYFFRLYIHIYSRNPRGGIETTFPPPQLSVSARSHLEAFSGTLPEGDSTTEDIYINPIALPMKRE